MKWHCISQVAKIVNLSRQAVYKRMKRLPLEEKIKLGENLIEDGQILLSDEGIKLVFNLSTSDNKVDTVVVKEVDTSVNQEVVEGIQNQLVAKEKEVVRLDDILGKVLNQLEEERRLRGEERQRTDTILMKLTNDISTLQKCLEYKKPEPIQHTSVPETIIKPRKDDTSPRSAPKIVSQVRELSLLESFQLYLNDFSGFFLGRG